MIEIDGTYKLTELNYPYIVMATMDLNHKCIPIGIAITSQ